MTFLVFYIIVFSVLNVHAQNEFLIKKDAEKSYYMNPILGGDYPDPTIVRDGNDYYMTHSAFNYLPGLTIFHSKDLVRWCAVAESTGLADGLFEQDYFQPAGVVRASIERRGGAVVSAAIGGPVTLDEPVCITL